MINIGPLHPPVSTPKVKKYHSSEAAVAGTEINKDAPHVVQQQQQERRRRRDRRQSKRQTLMDLRTGRERRDDPDVPSIDIEV